MLYHYLIMTLRMMRQDRVYALINIFGLAVGIACFLLIALFVQHELSYDRYHAKKDRIYRVLTDMWFGDQHLRGPQTSGMLGPTIMEEIPDIVQATRIYQRGPQSITYREKPIKVEAGYAETTLFQIFSFTLLSGDPATVLDHPNTVVLSESLARRMFGKEEALGKIVSAKLFGQQPGGPPTETPLEITGVMADVPEHSHFTFDCLISFRTVPSYLMGWGALQFWTYVLLRDGSPSHAVNAIQDKFLALTTKHRSAKVVKAIKLRYVLQPLTRIYFDPEDAPNKGDIRYVYAFSAIAVLILFMACANYMNLATARTLHRTREVGVRKVLGASRPQLIRQFLSESVLFTLLALPFAELLLHLALPYFNGLTQKSLVIEMSKNTIFVQIVVASVFLVGVLSGSYPAFFLSAFQPVEVLTSRFKPRLTLALFRKGLIVLQFTISIALIACTVIVQRQMSYIQNKDLGFDKNNLIVIPLQQQDHQSIKTEILRNPNVLRISAAVGMPQSFVGGPGVPVRREGMSEQEAIQMSVIRVDEDFVETMGMKLLEGRNFSTKYPTDATRAYLLNEAAMRKLGWTSAVGKQVMIHPMEGWVPVIGVVKNFYSRSLHHEIDPVMFTMGASVMRSPYSMLLVRIHPDHVKDTVASLEQTWKKFTPDRPFEFHFLDDNLNQWYQKEQRLAQIFGLFSLLAIFIACLGLFGLVAFTAEQRTKEMGIRKVLGASVTQILVLLSKDFVKLVLIANLVAWPIAYLAMRRWLQDFAYRVDLGFGTFLLAGMLTLGIALLTISSQALRVTRTNPVESLRYE